MTLQDISMVNKDTNKDANKERKLFKSSLGVRFDSKIRNILKFYM